MKRSYSDQKHMVKTNELDNHPLIKGYDFSNDFDFDSFIKSFGSTGFQATEFFKAVTIMNTMIEEKVPIYFSFTGNAISSGLRDIITFLVKQKKMHTIITTASGVEEDIIKSLSSFKLGEFDVSGRSLFEHGVGRIGNIFVPNNRYLYFERFLNELLTEVFKEKKVVSPSYLLKKAGLKLGEDSYLYWAAKNDVPVYCPGIMDGSFGDIVYFFKQKNKDFIIDVTEDHVSLVNEVLQQEKAGALILGGGISKHYNLNAQIFREGFDYAIYLTTASEFDGSDSGGNQEEAKTWAKIKLDAPTAKVRADFSLTFPLLIASTLRKK
ncbi:deoxyhypusine synthase family protein [Candidatus Woesearchaeota archaeon]|nr:deoxyhypusine synthase family protein [Candidatus Woesearchaeota archaeon]